MALLIFIAILVVLVWVHELGHFSVAKLFGVRVDEFAIGFPPRLLTVVWGETRYSFNLILVGGYVSIQQNTNGIATMNWSNVIDSIQDDGTNLTLGITLPSGSRFYRLFKP